MSASSHHGSSGSGSSLTPIRARGTMGWLEVQVLKGSGRLFEEKRSALHRIRCTLGQASFQTPLRKTITTGSTLKRTAVRSADWTAAGADSKAEQTAPAAAAATFRFPVGLPTDLLSVQCVRGSGEAERVVGSLSIALAHLPQSSVVTKYFELKAAGQGVGVLQLRLQYALTYSVHRRDATASLTIVPSQGAREFLRKEYSKYARSNQIQYRVVDYLLVMGVKAPVAAWDDAADDCSRASSGGGGGGGGSSSKRRNVPTVLERYPASNRSDFALPPQLESFVFPLGWTPSPHWLPPRSFSFRLNHQTTLQTDQAVAVVLCYWRKVCVPAPPPASSSSPGGTEEDEQEERSLSGTGGGGGLMSSSSFSNGPEEPRESSLSRSRSRNTLLGDDLAEISPAPPGMARARSGGGSGGHRGSGSLNRLQRFGMSNTLSATTDHEAFPLTPSYRVTPVAAQHSQRPFASPSPSASPQLRASASCPINISPHLGPISASVASAAASTVPAPILPVPSGLETPGTDATAGTTPAFGRPTAASTVTLWAPTCLVIVSRLSLIPQYTQMLVTLYKHFLTTPEEDASAVHPQSQAAAEAQHSCPVCVDPTIGQPRCCAMASAAVAHHNETALQRRARAQAEADGSAALAQTQSQSAAAASSLNNHSSSSSAASVAGAKNRHRMDLSGVSSNLWSAASTSAASSIPSAAAAAAAAAALLQSHQPDISAVGSLPVPPTPSSAHATPISTSAAAASAGGSAAAPHFYFESEHASLAHMATPTSPETPLPRTPLLSFVPFSAAFGTEQQATAGAGAGEEMPACATSVAGSAAAAPCCCSPSCCPCSCCTVRVDCRGLTFEQCVRYLVDEVPLPRAGAPAGVTLHLCCQRIRVSLPASELDFPQLEFRINQAASSVASALAAASAWGAAAEMPGSYADFDRVPSFRAYAPPSPALLAAALKSPLSLGLLDVLDLDMVLLLLRCILCEMKIVLHASSLALLHSVSDTLLSLCFPFVWSHVYIPLLPRALYGMLEAPVSFVVGIHSSGIAEVEALLGVGAQRAQTQRNENDEMREHAAASASALAVAAAAAATAAAMAAGGSSKLPVDAPSASSLLALSRSREPSVTKRASFSSSSNNNNHNKTPSGSDDEAADESARARAEQQYQQQQQQSQSQNQPQHDLSSFVFVDIDRGIVDVSVPPPPFPSEPTRALLRALRAAMRPQIFRADELAAATNHTQQLRGNAAAQRSARSKEDLRRADGTIDPNRTACEGGAFHLHYHSSAASASSTDNPFVTSTLPAVPASTAADDDDDAAAASDFLSSHARLGDRELRVHFLQFLASLITSYRDFLFFVSGATPVFDTPAFLDFRSGATVSSNAGGLSAGATSSPSSAPTPAARSDALPFLSRFLDTQIFRDFLDRHVEFPSYLQDFLLYINSHASARAPAPPGLRAPGQQQQQQQQEQEESFEVPPPEPLRPEQWSALLYARASLYAHALDSSASPLGSDSPSSSLSASASGAPEHLKHAALYASCGWGTNLPTLGLLASAPSELPSDCASLNAIFSAPRSFRVPQGDEGGGGGSNLGKNPSTLNHTLLFSKMYDGIHSSLAESGANSRLHTPTAAAASHDRSNSAGGSAGGAADASNFAAGAAAAASASSDSRTSPTHSIFQQAFSSFEGTEQHGDAESAAAAAAIAMTPSPSPPPIVRAHSLAVPSSSSRRAAGSAGAAALSVSVPIPEGSEESVVALAGSPASAGPPMLNRSQSSLLVRVGSGEALSPRHGVSSSSSQRQMSLNLLSKSAFERAKPSGASRLGQVVATLMKPRFGTPAAANGTSNGQAAAASSTHIDLGELSAVGELLALSEWRSSLVRLFGSGIDGSCAGLGLDTDHAAHRMLPTSSFLSLSLLFNIALEECGADKDYTNALALLHYSGRIYNLPGVETEMQLEVMCSPNAAKSPSANGAGSSGAAVRPDREYLRVVLRRQALWKDDGFWSHAYRSDIQAKLDHPSLPSTPQETGSAGSAPGSASSGSARSGSDAASASASGARRFEAALAAQTESRESTIFELICGLIYLQLSLGCAVESVRSVVEGAAGEFGLALHRQRELQTLVTNIARSTQAAATVPRSAAGSGGQQTQALSSSAAAAAAMQSGSHHARSASARAGPMQPHRSTAAIGVGGQSSILQFPSHDED